ncbi:RNA polymerase sigma factor sigF, chloroplastic [Canna indica]|uniref:RNA polymerase sigma factor sigF, chloroplastic n=1 Tax=Canna indica TaxID=4628 RepID=A0AAQ3K2K6_9LILI|nr:RNA polymerase sigma factor sigF, chloroplastic [Canna indica]
MATGTRFLHPSLPPKQTRTCLKNSSCPVAMLHDQAIRTVCFVPAATMVHPSAESVISKDRDDVCKTNSFKTEENSTEQANVRIALAEEYDFDQYQRQFEKQMLYHLDSWYRFPSFYSEEKSLLVMPIEQVENASSSEDKTMQPACCPNFVKPMDALVLAMKAETESREAALLPKKSNLLGEEFDECHTPISTKGIIIRSKRLLERQSKKRKVPKNLKNYVYKSTRLPSRISKKIDKTLDSNDPLRLFLRDPETKQLLTVKEEQELFTQVQDLMRLEEVQQKFQVQFNREPTLTEWAEAVGMSCQTLHSCLSAGRRSREKMIYANFRLVVHLARQYEGRGLELQDLLQEGSRGLMKSFEKFKPKAGCKFSTYAYWWIRQFIRKAIFRNSRLIRLTDTVFAFLKEIKYARRLCIQDGHLPTNEEIAERVGITAKKLEKLLLVSRDPVSIHQRIWQDITFQEITPDPAVDNQELIIAKKLMRQHLDCLLKNLKPRERQIIQYRFGIFDNKPKTLTDIGKIYGLSKERVRQLESRALSKLKEFLTSEGLEVYQELLV